MTDRQSAEPTEAPLLLTQLLFGKHLTYALSGVARLGVPDQMDGTPQSIDEIAAKVGAHAPSLYRAMRLLASFGVFKETPARHFALTPAAALLKRDAPGSMRNFATMFGDQWSIRAFEHFTEILRDGGDGITKAFGKHVFDVLAEHPDQLATFQAAMTSGSITASRAILDAYDFGGIKRLADVGGGHGALLAAILQAYPDMRGVLFDREDVVADVPAERISGCDGRIGIEAGSFFERVPRGCDAYIMKHIIHDWGDEQCRAILGLMRDALPADGRVLICDMVVGDEPGPTPAKMLDIEMLVMTVGGKERTEQEFRDLLASSGLKLNRIVRTARPICVVEAVPA